MGLGEGCLAGRLCAPWYAAKTVNNVTGIQVRLSPFPCDRFFGSSLMPSFRQR
jgi:hypothetical protein